VAAASEDAKTDRLTLRLPSREIERLRELARQRRTDVATLAREAISAYLDANPREDLERLERALREAVRAEASRVIERHDETTRALIAALNEHLSGRATGKP
jgi:predicted DNA-binding protein